MEKENSKKSTVKKTTSSKNSNKGDKVVKVKPKKKVSVKSTTKNDEKVIAKKTIPAPKKKSVSEKKVVAKEEVKVDKVVEVIDEPTKKNNEVLKTVIVCALLVVLVGATFIIGLTKNKGKLLYQTHVGIKDTTVSEYLEIIKKEDTSIIYVGRPGCGYCQMFNPILTEVLNQYKIGVEYVNIEAISSQEEWDSFESSNDVLSSGEWGTPTLFIYKNGELVATNPGYVEKATLVQFLSDAGLIKGE